MAEKDTESGQPAKIPHFRQVIDQAGITPEVLKYDYDGSGTEEDPYVVVWIENDPRNPMLYTPARKWAITMMVSFGTLAVAFVSSSYSGADKQVIKEFKCTDEVFTLGTSVFVLGFAIGPLFWAPLSELFGRQIIFTVTYGALTIWNAAGTGAPNIASLIVFRFLGGAFGSSPLTNAGGVIADMFPARDRGVALSMFASAPFMGPTLGPIVGGFVGETIGWRWLIGIMAIFTGTLWILGTLVIPETYPPVLLRRRAQKLSKMTGKVYVSRGDAEQGPTTLAYVFKTSLSRPWVLLLKEPIVLLLSIYMAIVYGTLYMLFSAYPIVYQETRGWSQGVGGLPFLGVAVGMIGAVIYSIFDNAKRYRTLSDKYNGFAPPETRLPPTMLGGVSATIGLFWFAWTNYPRIQYMASIAAGVPFGFGMVLIFLGVMNYLIDAYTIFAASVLAANAVLRSLFGFAFPLFTAQMYKNLGLHWAGSIPAFLALMCVPMPFIFWKYGPKIRERCKYAAEAQEFMRKMQSQMQEDEGEEEEEAANAKEREEVEDDNAEQEEDLADKAKEKAEEREEEEEQAAIDYSFEPKEDQPHLEPIKPTPSRKSHLLQRHKSYDDSPFDLDRTNTHSSFRWERRPDPSRRSSKSSKGSKR